MATSTTADARPPFAIAKARTRFFGLSLDECIQSFFGGSALVAVIVLGLITVFLFREGAGFFTQNRQNITVYRQAGLEYVDFIRQQERDHTALTRYLSDIRLRTLSHFLEVEKLPLADANAKLAAFDDYAGRYSDAVVPIRGFVADLGDVAVAIKQKFEINEDRMVERSQLVAAGKDEEAAALSIEAIDFKTELQPILGALPAYKEANQAFAAELTALGAGIPTLPVPELQTRMERFKTLNAEYIASFPAVEKQLETWAYNEPVPFWQAFTAFIFGKQWTTASFWQDWYGILPLLTGSLMVSLVALTIAVPLGVGAAIYVNQIARPTEQKLIKPSIEFISAIPSVVLGFFGIAVLGTLLRNWSNGALGLPEWLQGIPLISAILSAPLAALNWVAPYMPGFPLAERLNVLTAGCLLALISVPTIFTLAEDAINNVPRAFKEASFALGASKLQTTTRIIVPAALSGIISAVLLGFGRVVGETMVVLLCAGNRIAIPDFTAGLGAFTQPVHTMTGIIAQEMGEVVNGSIHYRALFVVGIGLFFLSLLINYVAQLIVRRYRVSIG
jgi:phosphate transport system permease protein